MIIDVGEFGVVDIDTIQKAFNVGVGMVDVVGAETVNVHADVVGAGTVYVVGAGTGFGASGN